MTQEGLEGTLREFASLVDVEEELSPELRGRLMNIARAAAGPQQAAAGPQQVEWETTVSVACLVLIGINLLGAPLFSGWFVLASALCAGAYALGVRRLWEAPGASQ